MSNSPLVDYTKISPNSNPRRDPISKITIHHMAGNLSVETCSNIFSNPRRQASSNYGVGSDGRIGLYVEEKDRSWCSSSPWNDHKAITIEVANDGGAPDWHVSDRALESLINLCVDICKRNNIPELVYTGDRDGSLTRHNMFADTLCPGPYLQSKFPYIAEEVNKRLKPVELKYSVGQKVVIKGYLYTNSNASNAAGYVDTRRTTITLVNPGSKHPYNTTGNLGWMDEDSIKPYEEPALAIGDSVKIIGEGNGSSLGDSNTAYGIGWTREILNIYEGRPFPYEIGNASGTTGFYKEESIEKL